MQSISASLVLPRTSGCVLIISWACIFDILFGIADHPDGQIPHTAKVPSGLIVRRAGRRTFLTKCANAGEKTVSAERCEPPYGCLQLALPIPTDGLAFRG